MHSPVMGVYGLQPPFEFLHLTGVKLTSKRPEKLISISDISKPLNVRASSPVRHAKKTLSPVGNRATKQDYSNKLYTDYTTLKNELVDKNVSYNTQLRSLGARSPVQRNFGSPTPVQRLPVQNVGSTSPVQRRFGTQSPNQHYVHSSRLTSAQVKQNTQQYTHKNQDLSLANSDTQAQNARKNSGRSLETELQCSKSVRDLVANILHSVMNKPDNGNENPKTDINNNIDPDFTPAQNIEMKPDNKSRHSAGKSKNSGKKKNRKSKKQNVVPSPESGPNLQPHVSSNFSKHIVYNTDTNTIKTEPVQPGISISKVNPFASTMQKRMEMRRCRSLSHSNAATPPGDIVKQSTHSPLHRRKSLDLDVTIPAMQTSTSRRSVEMMSKRNTDVPLKIHKIYQSEKQTKTVLNMGEITVGAPPATPVPDLLQQIQYVACMADIRAQRAVKAELEMLQKKEKKRNEKELEEKRNLEKIQKRDTEKKLKTRQRLEIYALNKLMTEFENENFKNFCKANGIRS